MSGSEGREALRRYLQQRLDAGEKTLFLPEAASEQRAPESAEGARRASREAAATRTGATDASTARTTPADSLEAIAQEVRACTACRLHETRTRAVPGVGPADAALVFIGEGPGADEDARGEPFVGRAGQLLTKIIESVQLRREDVFITNIVKCRPPNNRDPQPDEIAACRPFLERQVQLLQPRVICTLGRHAASVLLGKQEAMARLRAGEHRYAGIRVFPTYHPAALLRNPQWKRPVWEDIQKVRRVVDGADEKT
jgi:DNA polymerase